MFYHESPFAPVCTYTVLLSWFAQCVAGSTVGFLCVLFVILYPVVTMGLTNLKNQKNRGQELCLELEIQVHKMFSSVICFDEWKLMYPTTKYISDSEYVFWLSRLHTESLHEWPHAPLPLQVSCTGTGLYNLTVERVRAQPFAVSYLRLVFHFHVVKYIRNTCSFWLVFSPSCLLRKNFCCYWNDSLGFDR